MLTRKGLSEETLSKIYIFVMMESPLKDILKLSVAERILIVEEIWNSIASEPGENANAFTDSQKKEIERRLNLYRSGQTKTYSWDEIKSDLRGK